jgi:hypothetical protein
MHWRGKDYRYEVIYPDGTRRTLLSVPRWDFNWQNIYRFEEPLKLPAGTKIHSVAHWDNSRNNPLNPAPEKALRFGLQTWDEMMVGWASFVYERPEAAAELAKNPPKPADRLFDQLDVNGDDVLTPDEIPYQWKPAIKLLSLKLPEKMTRKEFGELFDKISKRFGRPKPKDATKKESQEKKS